MKLLFDENLSPRLVELLADAFPGCAHVHGCGLGGADDEAIWGYARVNGFTIVSRDSDFQERSILRGSPPKIVWLRNANCSNSKIAAFLRGAFSIISRFIETEEETCLVLRRS